MGAVLSLHRADIYASFRSFFVGFLRKRREVCELVILARCGHRSSHSHMSWSLQLIKSCSVHKNVLAKMRLDFIANLSVVREGFTHSWTYCPFVMRRWCQLGSILVRNIGQKSVHESFRDMPVRLLLFAGSRANSCLGFLILGDSWRRLGRFWGSKKNNVPKWNQIDYNDCGNGR